MRFSDDLRYRHLHSPLGPLLLAGAEDVVHLISFPQGDRARSPRQGWVEDGGAFSVAADQLTAYFAGARRSFDFDLFLNGTAFQRAVWTALPDVPFGETASYADIARRIGKPSATRAVGAANGANPLPIVLPCHRIVGANGALTGFGGGLDAKRYLLDLEARAAARESGRLI